MQIFADFAGYSLIAIGAAAVFGYRLPDNFNFPYIAQSVSEFWRRWHISLSSWLREYLYYSLGGNRKSAARTYINLLLVMFLGGLWHGAAWSYAVWGTWHGMALALERPFLRSWLFQSRAIPLQILRIGAVFLFVSLSWLLFQLPAFDQALAYLGSAVRNTGLSPNLAVLLVIALFSFPVIVYHLIHLVEIHRGKFLRRFEPALYGAFLLCIVFNQGNQAAFIYFQF
jgi:alginate O-acetyltransferase complex protein AlgI